LAWSSTKMLVMLMRMGMRVLLIGWG